MNKKTTILFFIIILLASFLRIYKLNQIPPGVNRDEASIGVTANSIMNTGRDEYGRQFPLTFESFGDWKLPLYIYTTIPFVKIFGLSEVSVRLPSALAGIASIAALYFLMRLLLGSEAIALLSSLSLALMPWHIHISRVESEAIVAVLWTILGSIYFLKALKYISLKLLIYSALLFAATYYTYHGNHIFTSLLLIGMATIYWRDIIKIPRWWIALGAGAALTGMILIIGLSADHTKLSGISIFGDPTIVHAKIELPRLEHNNPNSLAARIIHNRVVYSIITVSHNYLKSYGPEFLFIKGGGNTAHNILGYGNLHPIEAPLLLLGFACLMSYIKKKENKFILWWLAISAVAAAITKDAPHSNRMLAVVPSLAIMTALGIYYLYQLLPKYARQIYIALLCIGYLFSMMIYADQYYGHFPKTEAKNWGYAYKQLTPILFSPENIHKNIIMTHPEISPYIYLMFYSAYNPGSYQKEAIRYPISNDGFTDVAGFGRFSFRAIDWSKDPSLRNTLLVTKSDELPSDLSNKIIASITLPDNSIQFVVLDNEK